MSGSGNSIFIAFGEIFNLFDFPIFSAGTTVIGWTTALVWLIVVSFILKIFLYNK